MIREIQKNELDKLIHLYSFLHKNGLPDVDDKVKSIWDEIFADKNHHVIVAEEDDILVSSCVCVIIPNLTQKMKPYAFIENVVTNPAYRNKGYATACLNYAKELASVAGCYKMMLLTGSKEKSTHDFYKKAGYNCNDKTGYIQWL